MGVPVPLTLRERNGHLYFDDLRLTEAEPLLFVASNGEVLDLRSEPGRWRSVPVRKIAEPTAAAARDTAVRRASGLYELLREERFEAFLAECTQRVQTALRSPLAHSWRSQGGAAAPARAEVDDLGATTRVLLFIPGDEEGRRVQMKLDDQGRLAALWFSDAAPRTWWQMVGSAKQQGALAGDVERENLSLTPRAPTTGPGRP